MITEVAGRKANRRELNLRIDKPPPWITTLPSNVPVHRACSEQENDFVDSSNKSDISDSEDEGLSGFLGRLMLEEPQNKEIESSESDNEVEENFIPRGPGRNKSLRNASKSESNPYPITQSYYISQNKDSGGYLNVLDSVSPDKIATTENYETNKGELWNVYSLNDITKFLSESQSSKLYEVLDILSSEKGTLLPNTRENICEDIFPNPSSVDDGYDSLSSVASPFSINSPTSLSIPDQRISLVELDSGISISPQQDINSFGSSSSDVHEAFPSPSSRKKLLNPDIQNVQYLSSDKNEWLVDPAAEVIDQTQAIYPNVHTPLIPFGEPELNSTNKPKHIVSLASLDVNCGPHLHCEGDNLNNQALFVNNRKTKPLKPDVVATVQESIMKEPAQERLNKLLNKPSERLKLEIENERVALQKENSFYGIDSENETRLMKVLLNPTPALLQTINAIVERVRRAERIDYLLHKDSKSHDALYMAATKHQDKPIIARYIADTIISLGGKFDKAPFEDYLLHVLARCGDSHASVLAELLNAVTERSTPAFDVNQRDLDSRTPLFIAAQTHSASTPCTAISKVLLDHGAVLNIKDAQGRTPLHVAIKESCDPILVKVLLQPFVNNDSAINSVDSKGDSALHYAASRNDIPPMQQYKVIRLLKDYGAKRNAINLSGKYPVSLVDPLRREAIELAFNKWK